MLLKYVKQLAPGVLFEEGASFCWIPETRRITYVAQALSNKQGVWSLLHEVGHSLLEHQGYATDFELVKMEAAAWEKAKELATQLGTAIDEDHIQDCLDTYRDWLHRRSKCPTCGSVSLQSSATKYLCHNCNAEWAVTPARFRRPYRRMTRSGKTALPR